MDTEDASRTAAEYEDDDALLDAAGGMSPDHPLLARAQAALKAQLLETNQRLEEELREKSKLLSDAQKKREGLGVDLFGFQQQLAKLQVELEKAHEKQVKIATSKQQAQQRVQELKEKHEQELNGTKEERNRAHSYQDELDRQAATLRQIEAYNEEMKTEIAVARRATYKAEEAVQKLEKEKISQDNRIDKLQEQLKSLHQQSSLYASQIEAQALETRAAMDTLVEAEKEMETVHFEKRQLVSQWQSTLLAIARREEALTGIGAAMEQQQEQEMNILNELGRFKKDIREQQVRHETLSGVMAKLEADLGNVQRSIETLQDKQQHLNGTYVKLEKALEGMDGKVKRADMETAAVRKEMESVDKAFMKANAENSAVEEKMAAVLSNQTTFEKGAGNVAKEIQQRRKDVREKELRVISIQNEVAKIAVDVLNTEAHNRRLDDTLQFLDEELQQKAAVIEKYETEMSRRNDDIEKKTRAVDSLNRTLEKLTADAKGVDNGPLEATIFNLSKEIQQKGAEDKELQRRWINLQTDLVAKQNENSKHSEGNARLASNYSILFQKKIRLEQELEREQKEIKNIGSSMDRLNQDMIRLNKLIAKNAELAGLLTDDTFNLQSDIMAELKAREAEAVELETAIEAETRRKQECLSDIVETERQVLLWERKIQLQREMQDMIDPNVGQDLVGSMKKEIHRMQLRKSELERLKEQLMKELERAISKRDTITVKGRAQVAISKERGTKLTERQLQRKCQELQGSIGDTEKECRATDARVRQLDAERAELANSMEAATQACAELRRREGGLRAAVEGRLGEKTAQLLRTARLQAVGKAMEEAEGGRYAPAVADAQAVEAEREAALRRQRAIVEAVEAVGGQNDGLLSRLRRVLLHAQAAQAVS